jgi:hypothetical protein
VKWIVGVGLFFVLAALAWGATLQVPQDYPTVQAAVDAALPGDEILISPGTYHEDVEIEKTVRLRGLGEVQIGTSLLEGVSVIAGTVSLLDLKLGGPLQVEARAHAKLSGCTLGAVRLSGGATLELEGCEGAEGGFGLMALGPGTLIARDCQLAKVMLVGGVQAVFVESRILGLQMAQASVAASGCEFVGDVELGYCSLALSDCCLEGAVSMGPEAGAVLEGCTIEAAQIGLSLRATAQVEAKGCRFLGGKTAIDISDEAEVELVDCEISGCEEAGIRAWDRSRLQLIRVRVTDSGEYGVLAKGTVSLHADGSTFSRCGDGLRLLSGATAALEGCLFSDNRFHGVAALSGSVVTGRGNEFCGNGCDLLGNVALGVRKPLREASEGEVCYPSPTFATLQEAIDALLPGGTLVLSGGLQTAGVVVAKPITVRATSADGCVLIAPAAELPVISVVPGGELYLEDVELRGGTFGLIAAGESSVQLTGMRVAGSKVGIELWDVAKLEMEGCILTENGTGLELRGDSQAIVSSCSIVENASAGIYLWDQVSLYLSGSAVTGNRAGVICYVQGCDSAWAPGEFSGTVTGTENIVSDNTKADLCPPYPGDPWPEGFLKEE